MTELATLASFFGGFVLCYALVSIGAFASNHVAASLNLADYRADDSSRAAQRIVLNNNCAYFRIRKSNVETLKSPQNMRMSKCSFVRYLCICAHGYH